MKTTTINNKTQQLQSNIQNVEECDATCSIEVLKLTTKDNK